MVATGTPLYALQIIVALITVLAAVKSAYNGTVREMVVNVRRIEDVAEEVDDMSGTQDDLVDAVSAIYYAESSESLDLDPTSVEVLKQDGGAGRFVNNGKHGRYIRPSDRRPDGGEQDSDER